MFDHALHVTTQLHFQHLLSHMVYVQFQTFMMIIKLDEANLFMSSVKHMTIVKSSMWGY